MQFGTAGETFAGSLLLPRALLMTSVVFQPVRLNDGVLGDVGFPSAPPSLVPQAGIVCFSRGGVALSSLTLCDPLSFPKQVMS